VIELVPASGLSNAALAAAFTEGLEGYQFPIRIDEAAFAAMAKVSDFDLDRSRVALSDGEPVGLVLIGVRGEQAWIGGLGVALSERRHGLGRRLMEAVLDRELHGELVRKSGVMGVVVESGEVRPGDPIQVELPPEPHVRLEPV